MSLYVGNKRSLRSRNAATGAATTPYSNGYSALFDRVNESAVGSTALNSLLERNVAWSISFWTKMTTATGDQLILSNAANAAPYRGLWIYAHGATVNNLEIQYYSNYGTGDWLAVRVSAVPVGTWCHWLICYDGSGNRTGFAIYKNGVLETNSYPYGASSVSGTTTGTKALTWGAGDAGTIQYYGGGLDEGAIFPADKRADKDTVYNGGATLDLMSFSPSGYWRFGDTDYNAHPTVENVANPGTCDLTMTNTESTDFVVDVP